MSKRVNVRRLLRKHRTECVQRLDGISMYEDQPYDHNTEQIIKACEEDIRMIDRIFRGGMMLFALNEVEGFNNRINALEQELERKDEKILELMERIEELTYAPIIEN